MNNAQKLADEALQVYRLTGLSPLEIESQRKDLIHALSLCKFDSLNMSLADMRLVSQVKERCK